MLVKVASCVAKRSKLTENPYPQNLLPGELVNGSVGQVVRFSTPAEATTEHTEIANLEGTGIPLSGPAAQRPWPVVRFISGREIMCIPQQFTVNNVDGGMEACREQVCVLHCE